MVRWLLGLWLLLFCTVICAPLDGVAASVGVPGWQRLQTTAARDRTRAVQLARAGQYDPAIALLNPYLRYPHRFPHVVNDYITILNWSRAHWDSIRYWSHHERAIKLPLYARMALADSYFQIGHYHAAEIIYSTTLQFFPAHQPAAVGVIRSLLKMGQHHKAYLQTLDFHRTVLAHHASDALAEIGWAFYRLKQYQHAVKIFELAYGQNRHHLQANVGLIYCHIWLHEMEQAGALLAAGEARFGRAADFLYAKAFYAERMGDAWVALESYTRILAQHPDDRVARRGQLQNMAKLGAVTQARTDAARYFPDDTALQREIELQHWKHQLRWQTTDPAVMSRALQSIPEAQFDYIATLHHAHRPLAAIAHYETALAAGERVPNWLKVVIADAYMVTEQQQKALALYSELLQMWPGSGDLLLGKYYALAELQHWDEAEAVLREMERMPWTLGRPPHQRINAHRVDAALARGSWLIEQRRLPEAQAYFARLQQRAPGNLDFKKAMAGLYSARGWHRKALAAYRVIDSLESRDLEPPSRVDLSDQLYTLKEKAAAHALLDRAAKHYPYDLGVQRLQHDFQVQEMRALGAHVKYENSQDGAIDRVVGFDFSQPLSLQSNLLFHEEIRRSSQQQLHAAFDRFSVGIDHDFNSGWYLKGMLSGDHGTAGDFGALIDLRWMPDDHWTLEALYNSYNADIDMRSRVYNISSDQLGLRVDYRWGDWRQAGLSLYRSRFSDGNIRSEATFHADQHLYAKGDWLVAMNGELYTARNSHSDSPYFNPRRTTSASATLRIDDHAWHRSARMSGDYTHSFSHHLELTLGRTWQAGFAAGTISRIAYGQDFDFSDRQSLQWHAQWGRQPYDGVQVGSYVIEGDFLWRF